MSQKYDVFAEYNKWRVLRVFFEDPSPGGAGFQLREIGRKIGIAPTSVKNYLDELSKKDPHLWGFPLIEKGHVHGYPVYWANRSSELFLFYKKMDMVLSIHGGGLLDHVWDICAPDAIVLFGSAAKGEDLKGSDIDLFVQSKEHAIDLGKFEKQLTRRVSLFFAEDFSKLSKELKNNILNGIVLRGYVKVF